jgi:glycosyltransferase involved in cell wall biosynthesis
MVRPAVKFTVCVPTVRPGTLEHTVRSIIAQTWSDWELLIVGQGDDPALKGMGERVERMDSRIRYIHLDQRGISRARNAGLAVAGGEIVAMTDDDCEAAPDWLAALAALFERYPRVGVVGGALRAPRVSRWKLESCLSYIPAEAICDPKRDEDPPEGWGWIGANFALRKTVADQIGPFDECLGAGASVFPAAEDIDYRMRLSAAGVVTLSSPAPVVFHTYGVRRGVRQNLRLALAYARGNAGLDGKLTLMGNPHGQWSASRVLRGGLIETLRSGKLYRLPIVLLYGWTYQAAYQRCLREFVIGPDGALSPVKTTAKVSVAS